MFLSPNLSGQDAALVRTGSRQILIDLCQNLPRLSFDVFTALIGRYAG